MGNNGRVYTTTQSIHPFSRRLGPAVHSSQMVDYITLVSANIEIIMIDDFVGVHIN